MIKRAADFSNLVNALKDPRVVSALINGTGGALLGGLASTNNKGLGALFGGTLGAAAGFGGASLYEKIKAAQSAGAANTPAGDDVKGDGFPWGKTLGIGGAVAAGASAPGVYGGVKGIRAMRANKDVMDALKKLNLKDRLRVYAHAGVEGAKVPYAGAYNYSKGKVTSAYQSSKEGLAKLLNKILRKG